MLDLTNPGPQGSDKRNLAPKEAWRPHLELDENGGYFVSTPQTVEASDASELMREFDLDPAQWIVTGVRRSKWQRYDGEWLTSYRVNVRPRNFIGTLLDPSEIEEEIRKWRPGKVKPVKGDNTFLAAIGDTQWGKDAGGGTEQTVARVMAAMQGTLARFHEVKGYGVGQIALPQMGDCIEGIVSQGGRIAGRIDLPLTAQIRLGRRVLLEWVKAFAPLTEKLIIPVVPGNHDESTRALITDPLDSFQVEIVAQVLDICRDNPSLQNVEGRFIESDNTTLAVDLSGIMVGFAHGHQSRTIPKWWEGQALGQTPVGGADLLITGHYHHFIAQNLGPRMWIQIPSMDGGSAWFRDRKGLDSPPGIVTMLIGEDVDPRRHLAVIN
jgi:predicted phosphodiesterase